jgi:lysophospholipase L1-like esterase
MQQILVYSDSLSWGIIPMTRQRLPFDQRWPGVLEITLRGSGKNVRVIEDCLNGRRTVWDDPYKPGRNGLIGLAQRIEVNSPLELVILMLGTNDFQSMHEHNAWHASQGIAALVSAIRTSPIEPSLAIPKILVVSPPAIQNPKGPIAPKFAGAEKKCIGLADAYQKISEELGCYFFDAGCIITTSAVDGVHLDVKQHQTFGNALSKVVMHLL